MNAPAEAQPSDNPVIVEMRGVSIGSLKNPSFSAVEHIDWQVRKGDYWAIAGLQGSGKSDLLMTTAGLLPASSGSYRMFGEQMPIFDEHRMPTRMRTGIVFDGGQLFNHLTVEENIALPLRYHGARLGWEVNDRVQALLEATELGWAAQNTPGGLGRNWQKRAGLARALALQPELLLVDSPLAGLDLRHANWWLQFLDGLAQGHPVLDRRPLTIVVTVADLRPWRTHARQFAVLRDHKLLLLGTWTQLETASRQLLRDLLDEHLAHTEHGGPGGRPQENH